MYKTLVRDALLNTLLKTLLDTVLDTALDTALDIILNLILDIIFETSLDTTSRAASVTGLAMSLNYKDDAIGFPAGSRLHRFASKNPIPQNANFWIVFIDATDNKGYTTERYVAESCVTDNGWPILNYSIKEEEIEGVIQRCEKYPDVLEEWEENLGMSDTC